MSVAYKLIESLEFQVTNPAIDPLREGLVMSLEVNIGKRGNILEVGPENASQVCVQMLSHLQKSALNHVRYEIYLHEMLSF